MKKGEGERTTSSLHSHVVMPSGWKHIKKKCMSPLFLPFILPFTLSCILPLHPPFTSQVVFVSLCSDVLLKYNYSLSFLTTHSHSSPRLPASSSSPLPCPPLLSFSISLFLIFSLGMSLFFGIPCNPRT